MKVLRSTGTIAVSVKAGILALAGLLAAVAMGGVAAGAPLIRLDDTTPTAGAVLDVSKSAPEQVNPDSEFDYEITVTNTGDTTATEVVLTDTLPEEVEFVSLASGCTEGAPGEITCELGAVAPSGSATALIRVEALTAGTAVNTAEASATNADAATGSATTVIGDTTLSIDKSGPSSAAAGTRLTYEITVDNTGPVKAFGVDVEDFLPEGVRDVEFDDNCHLTAEDTIVFCDLGDIQVESHKHVEISFVVDEPGEVTNRAQVSGSNMSTDPEDEVTTNVGGEADADLELEKLATSNAAIGDEVVYTIVVHNRGGSPMTGVLVRDELPDGLIDSELDEECEEEERVVECDLGTIDVGESKQVLITVIASTAGVKVNTATVESDVEESGDEPNSDSATTTIAAEQTGEKMLIFGPTDTPALRQAATNAGFLPEVVSAAAWGEMTTADFRAYRALLIGDPFCSGVDTVAAATANASVWGAAVDGSVIIDGTDPVLHGRDLFTDAAVRFAGSSAGRTGAYVSLSCYYDSADGLTPVPLLDAFDPGGFTAKSAECFDEAHIVADHPALTGITDEYLSDWSCSVHESFVSWPDDFLVLAITLNSGSSYTAPDGTIGTPYILARGEGLTVISDITASTAATGSHAGTARTVSARVVEDDAPQVGKTVSFRVLSGPHEGTAGTATTDATGTAVFSYTGTAPGTDAIEATYVATGGATQTSNRLFVTWLLAPSPSPPSPPSPPVTETIPALPPAPPPDPPPPPEEPGTFNAQPKAGTVLLDGEVIRGTVELESGDVVDATNGTIEIVSDSGRAEFFDGAFKITQASRDNAVTRLELVGGDFSGCAARRTASRRADDKPVRRLWGRGTGKFETKARYSSATVRGTEWLTEDLCTGSLTLAEEGTVVVYDFSLRRTRVLAAGAEYLAEEPPPPSPGRFVGDPEGQVIVNGRPSTGHPDPLGGHGRRPEREHRADDDDRGGDVLQRQVPRHAGGRQRSVHVAHARGRRLLELRPRPRALVELEGSAQEERALALGQWQGQVQDEVTLQLGDGARHDLADGGPLRRLADRRPRWNRRGLRPHAQTHGAGRPGGAVSRPGADRLSAANRALCGTERTCSTERELVPIQRWPVPPRQPFSFNRR